MMYFALGSAMINAVDTLAATSRARAPKAPVFCLLAVRMLGAETSEIKRRSFDGSLYRCRLGVNRFMASKVSGLT